MNGYLLLVFSFLFVCCSSLRAADVEVTVDGVDTVQGQMLIGFYDSKETFRGKPLVGAKVKLLEPGLFVASFTDLVPGVYTLVAIWDKNGNGELDSNRFGVPSEPYAFSNNPKTMFGPPKYEQCTFVVPEQGCRLGLALLNH